jgi:hypothetical protein
MDTDNKIAIFNSFPFHFEMFGYIINFAKNNNYHIDIYTTFYNDLGWISFYNGLFSNITFLDYTLYNPFAVNCYKHIFVTTDDDRGFRNEWITDKVISINHNYKIRYPNYKKMINVGNFMDSKLEYSIPCYPVFKVSDKIQNNVVTIIGGHKHYRLNLVERLRSINGEPVTLNFIGRVFYHPMDVKGNFIVNCKTNMETPEMFKILKESSYIFINLADDKTYQIGERTSGSLQLIFNCLCKPIIETNNIYGLKNAIEFDADSNEPIILEPVDFNALVVERDYYINKFDNIVKNKLSITCQKIKASFDEKNTAIIVEPRMIEHLPELIRKFYNVLRQTFKFKFYCGKDKKKVWLKRLKGMDIQIIELKKNNFTVDDYNALLKSKKFYETIKSEYTLIFQHDAWIINTLPISTFINLNKSYIGGNMNYRWFELERENIFPTYKNFNGGLSLRKTNDMLRIIEEYPDTLNYPEDVYFTVGCYRLNLPIGDDEASCMFCNHTYITDKCFGIHSIGSINKEQAKLKFPEVEGIFF